MGSFPELKEDQVAIMRAKLSTGHVLDEYFIAATKTEQKVYTVFLNLNDGINAAKKIVSERRDVECVIYGPAQKALFYLSAEKTVEL